MQVKYKEDELSIPSMESDDIKRIIDLFIQSCDIVKEINSNSLDNQSKKEIIHMASDQEGGIEKGIESLTYIQILLNDFEKIKQLMIEKKQSQIEKSYKKKQNLVYDGYDGVNKPKKPLTPYFLFLVNNRERIKAENPDAKVTDIAKIASEEWKNLDEQTKKYYFDQSEYAKEEYKKAMIMYESKNNNHE